MNIISEDIYFRKAVEILLAEASIDFSGVVCVDGGQVVAFFRPSVTGKDIENFFNNCFLIVDKRSRPDKIRQLLTEAMLRGLRPVFSPSSRELRIFTLLSEGESYEFISSVFSLSFGSICYFRNKILSRYGVKNLNVFLVVMHRLKNSLSGKTLSQEIPLPQQFTLMARQGVSGKDD